MHIHTSDQQPVELGFGGYTVNPGIHLCALYENEKERDEIVFGFLGEGLRRDELNICVLHEADPDDFRSRFSTVCPDCASGPRNPDSLLLLQSDQMYFPNGSFDPVDMGTKLDAFYADSQANGPRGVRAIADMGWLLHAQHYVDPLMGYESRSNRFVVGKPWIGICLYDVAKFPGSIVMEVLRTHPFTISGGVVVRNPFYIPPDEWDARASLPRN